MPTFKQKKQNKVLINSNSTIDSKHSLFIKEFENDENVVIPSLKNKILKLKEEYNNGILLERSLDIKDEISNINNQIKKLKKKKSDYYLKNSKLIFDYFEDKKNISISNQDNSKKLNNYFGLNSSSNNNELQIPTKDHTNEYLKNVDVKYLDMNKFVFPSFICTACKQGELIPVEHEGVLICNNNKCGKQFQFLTENEKPSYREPPQEVCFYAYKRINHFREILAQFQAKESTQIPPDVLTNIRAQIKKERININTIDNKKAKEILKKLGYNKYYEHIPFIKDKLGIKPPVMTPDLEERLCSLFIEIQRPYSKFCPDDRVNFLNYYYTVYKLCELLGQTEFLEYFPMLKDRDKRIEQDEIWRKICTELNWEFIPTH
tara:strand:- start:345 stop:1472 length:1128 start_codon:yes stop_codon:yes gene_type:complete